MARKVKTRLKAKAKAKRRATTVRAAAPPSPRGLSASDVMAFVATSDPKRARRFYEDTLGLRLISADEFALAFDANGVMLRVQIVQRVDPAPYTALGWAVRDIAETLRTLSSAGVSFERYPWMNQNDLGVWTAPSGAKIAWFKDTDGNTLSVTEL